VFLDVASYGRRAIELCLTTFGIRQLLYGSDLPVVDPLPTLHAVRGFGDAVADAICGENPTLLFG
jgi:predicted TIM-barrel fold metal-dependent hydrolase